MNNKATKEQSSESAFVPSLNHQLPISQLFFHPTIEECDLCHEYKPILRTHRSPDAITYTGKQFLCPRCSAAS